MIKCPKAIKTIRYSFSEVLSSSIKPDHLRKRSAVNHDHGPCGEGRRVGHKIENGARHLLRLAGRRIGIIGSNTLSISSSFSVMTEENFVLVRPGRRVSTRT